MGNIRSAILIMLLALTFGSCKDDSDRIKTIYKDQDKVIRLFENVSIFSRGNFIYLSFFFDSLENSYVFERALNTDSLILVADTMRFDPKKTPNLKLEKEEDVTKCLHFYLDKMNHYGIEAVSSNCKKDGVPLQLYLKEARLFYVPVKHKIHNEDWQYYMETSNKLDENWYWRNLYDFYGE